MTSTSKASPIVKWAGAKRRLLPELLARVPKQFGRYYEPFAGGAALFFGLAPERAVLGDINADLIETYRAVAEDPAGVIRILRGHAREHSAEHYYRTRDRWNAQRARWTCARVGAGLIYFLKTCFNGLWRVNRSGEFNVPLGRYENPTICEPEVLRTAHAAFRRTELRAGDFRSTVADIERGDFCYFDPPYLPASSTSNFTSYSRDGFGLEDQQALADTARRLVARGAYVVLTNSDVPTVRRLYRGFRIETVKVARSINSDASGRGEVSELIITSR